VTTENPTGAWQEPRPSRKRKRWPWIVGSVVLALVVLSAIGAAFGEDETPKVAATEPVETTTTKRPTTTTDAPTTTTTPPAPPTTTAPPPPPTTAAPPPPPPTPPPPPAPVESISQSNARGKAADYLDYTAFSRKGLIDQLKFEGFSEGDATYGVDALDVDWNAQAAKKAADYLDYTSFSRSGLIEQLVYEGFSQAEAEYGVSTTGL
jgi:type IV secretory pathway VirB10-like protein